MAMTELALAGAKAGAAEPVVVGGTLAAPSAGNGSIFTGPRLSLSIAILVASRPLICLATAITLCCCTNVPPRVTVKTAKRYRGDFLQFLQWTRWHAFNLSKS